jgi:hypothetical protein
MVQPANPRTGEPANESSMISFTSSPVHPLAGFPLTFSMISFSGSPVHRLASFLVHAVLFASDHLTPQPCQHVAVARHSLSLLILFGFSTALLWNGGREPRRGAQTTFA